MDSTGANRVYVCIQEVHVAPGENGSHVEVTLWQRRRDVERPIVWRYGAGPTVVSALEAGSFALRDDAAKQGIVSLS